MRGASPRSDAAGEWLPAVTPADRTLRPEVALARQYANEQPHELFDLALGLRSVQARAPNTRRAYAADWQAFVACCQRHGFEAAPATPAAVETFIEFRSPEPPATLPAEDRIKFHKYVQPGEARDPLSPASLRRAIAAIAAVHRWLHYLDPTKDQDVKDTLTINVTGRQVQSHKDPLRWEHIERARPLMGTSLWGLRDQALLAVASSTLFRRCELVALTVADYQRVPGQPFGRMIVGKTKGKDPKDLEFRPVVPEAVERLEAWLAAANIREGPLFRGITPDRKVKKAALSAGEVARTFKIAARLAGLDEARIGGHSTRIGAAHDLDAFGAELQEIMLAGGWLSLAVLRYLRGQQSDQGAMARMARARQRKNAT